MSHLGPGDQRLQDARVEWICHLATTTTGFGKECATTPLDGTVAEFPARTVMPRSSRLASLFFLVRGAQSSAGFRLCHRLLWKGAIEQLAGIAARNPKRNDSNWR